MDSTSNATEGIPIRTTSGSSRRSRRPDGSDLARQAERARAHDLSGEATAFADAAEVFPRARSERLNRGVNLVLGIIGLVLLAPLLLLIAVLVKLTSRGPILYTQTRVGIDRRWKRT